MTNQNERVLAFLQKGKTLTSKQAVSRFKIANLRARITELRADGHKITKTPIKFKDTGARGVVYSLTKKTARR